MIVARGIWTVASGDRPYWIFRMEVGIGADGRTYGREVFAEFHVLRHGAVVALGVLVACLILLAG